MHTLYYEDLEIGTVYRSAGRTATESDNTMFCMLSGDWNPIHCNTHYAEQSRFGGRIVPGLYGLSMITGAMTQWGVFEKSAVAMLNMKGWAFKAPIMIGDTLYVEMKILEKRLTSSGKTGVVERAFSVLSHDGMVYQQGTSDMMILVCPEND